MVVLFFFCAFLHFREEAIQTLWKRHDTYGKILRSLFLQQHTKTSDRNGPVPPEGRTPAGGGARQRSCTCGLCSILAFDEFHQGSPLLPHPQQSNAGESRGPSGTLREEALDGRAPEHPAPGESSGDVPGHSSCPATPSSSVSWPPRSCVSSFHLSGFQSPASAAPERGLPCAPPYRRSSPHSPPVYLLLDGPPYANGVTHMGHAVNKCLKDFVTRYWRTVKIVGCGCYTLDAEWLS